MPERIYQLRFDESFFAPSKGSEPTVPKDVTPEDSLGFTESKRLSRFVREVPDRVCVTSPPVAAQYLLEKVYTPFEDFDQEEMWLLLLNTRRQVTHEVMVYRGQVNAIHVREAEVFKEAVRVNAPAFIMSHCHPSGDPIPSPEDVNLTVRINKAANVLGLEVVDHLIVGKDSWVSLREQRMGFDD